MRYPIFHSFVVGSLNFEVAMTGLGPYLFCKELGARVAIAPSLLVRHVDYSDSIPIPIPGWCLVKYRNELCVSLSGFNDEQAQAFAAEIGVPIERGCTDQNFFNHCPASDALVAWAERNPMMVKKYQNPDANGKVDWYSQLLHEHGIAPLS